jgi:transglutaminase-like putative cysteine protease
MKRFLLTLIVCLTLAPALAAQTTTAKLRPPAPAPQAVTVQPDITVERYASSYDVNADGTFTGTVEVLKRLNTKAAVEGASPLRISYNAELQTVEIVEAYVLKPDGKRVNVPATSIKTELSPEAVAAPEFTSFKLQSVTFPELKTGSAVFFKFRLTQTKPIFDGHFDMLEVFPANSVWDSVQVSVSAPANYPLYWDGVDVEGGRLADGADGRAHWLWKAQVKEALTYEPAATDIMDYSPRLAISNFQDYKALGAAYWAEAGKKSAPTPAVRALAGEITKDIAEPQAQARAIYQWVNKNIRYLAILVGRGTIIPHEADAILEHRYGDCKDYATLLQSLLAAKGIESVPVVVRADTSNWFPKVPAMLFFNHMILYLPSLDIYLDATNPNTPFGVLPMLEAGKNVLLAGEQTGTAQIPQGKPQENLIESQTQISVLADGDLKAASSVSYHGRMEMLYRPLFGDMKLEQSEDAFKIVLAMYGHKGTGRFVNIGNAYRTGEAFKLGMEIELVDAARLPGPASLAIPAGIDLNSFADLAKLVELEKRKTVLLSGAFNFRQQFSLSFPQGINVGALPQDISFENAAGRYTSVYKNEAGVVQIRRELIINQDIYTPKEYPAFRELIMKSVEDAKAQIGYSPAKDYQPAKTSVTAAAASGTTSKSETMTVISDLFESIGLLDQGAKLSRRKAEELETQLVTNPANIKSRALLLSYYSNGTETRAKKQARVRHRTWFIQNRPDVDLDFFGILMDKNEGSEYQQLKTIWLQQIEQKKNDPQLLYHASQFFRMLEPERTEQLLRDCQQLEPENYKWATELGKFYADRARDKEGEEKTKNLTLALEQYEKGITLNKSERSRQRDRDRPSLLRGAASAAFEIGQTAKAKSYATELLLEFGHDLTAYTYEDSTHYGNIILGRVALREGDLAKAKEHLLIAGRTPKLAGRTYYVPDMNLARELFEKNEKDTVIEYLQQCEGFYEGGRKLLQKWEQMIKKGQTPSFNLHEG